MRTPPSLSGRSRKAQSPQSSCGQQQTDMHSFFSTVVGVKRSRVPDTPPSEFSAAAIQSPPTPPWCRRTFEILTPPSNERNNQETSTTTFTDNRGVAIRINNSSSTVSFSNSTARDEIATTTKKASLQQLYLDLGQRDFAKQTICETCGMLFVHGLSEDAKEHKKMCHNFLHGVPFYAAKTARVVARSELGVVVEIRPSDSYDLRQKLKRVESIVNIDLGFVVSNDDETVASEKTAYLFLRDRRVLGMATAEIIKRAFVLNKSLSGDRSNKSQKAMVGIHKIWVHCKSRKQGVASMLVDTIRSKFIYGFMVPVQMLAFSSPTQAGADFANQYCNSDDDSKGGGGGGVLVYDCV